MNKVRGRRERKREREREGEREKERERQKDRERKKERQRQREIEREIEGRGVGREGGRRGLDSENDKKERKIREVMVIKIYRISEGSIKSRYGERTACKEKKREREMER